MYILAGFNVVMLLLTLNSSMCDQEINLHMRSKDSTREPKNYHTTDWIVMAWIGGFAAFIWFL
jgi:hypothetical protein